MMELQEYRKYMVREELHKSLNALVGLLGGIVSDGKVTAEESEELRNWYALHRGLINIHPYSEILPVLDEAFSDGRLDIDEASDVLWVCRQIMDSTASGLYFDFATSAIQQLHGILHGIITDGIIDDKELRALNAWLNEHDYLSGTYPFDEVYSLLLAAKEDGVFSDDEKNMLRAFFANFVDAKESANIHEPDVKALQARYSVQGICAIAPEITFDKKVFCFTGTSRRATRNEIARQIEARGGMYNDRVTNNTDYLVVGTAGNPCWAFACYGRKVEKAMQMRRDGGKVVIVNENDFWDEF